MADALAVLFLRVAQEHVLHDLFAAVHQTHAVVPQLSVPFFVLLGQGLVLAQRGFQLGLCRFIDFVQFLDPALVLGDDIAQVFLGLGLLLEQLLVSNHLLVIVDRERQVKRLHLQLLLPKPLNLIRVLDTEPVHPLQTQLSQHFLHVSWHQALRLLHS